MDQVERFLERPKLYYNIDGVGELGIGFMCLGYALLGWLQLHTPQNSVWHQMYTLFIYVAVMICIIHYGSKAIKNRITYKRTGFVEYLRRDKYWVPMAVGAGVSVLASGGLLLAMRRHLEISTFASLLGLLFAATYIPFARTVRWKWTMFCAMVAGTFIIAVLPADLIGAFAIDPSLSSAISAKAMGAFWLTVVVYGALLMISGGISFWLYLRHTQASTQDGQ